VPWATNCRAASVRDLKWKVRARFPWLKIIGVAGNRKEDTVCREMASESRPVLYRPFQQDPRNSTEVLVRFSGDSHGLAHTVGQNKSLSATCPILGIWHS